MGKGRGRKRTGTGRRAPLDDATPGGAAHAPRGTRPSRLLGWALFLSASLPVMFLLILRQWDVKLGQGAIYYRYSQLLPIRLWRCWPLVPIGAAAAGALWFLSRGWRGAGSALACCVVIALACWTWWLPPHPIPQHFFNFWSQSQDGAFSMQALYADSAADYLRVFDKRLDWPVEQMGGTRVLSNTPGMTLLIIWLWHAWPMEIDPPGWLERYILREYNVTREQLFGTSAGVKVSFLVTAMLAASGVFAYLLGRVLLSPGGAAVFAIAVTFNPGTVHFSPGKDPAQLLTINAMLWAAFAGWKTRSVRVSALAGALLVIGLALGLIHVWVTLAAGAAVAWQRWHERHSMQVLFSRNILPAAGGAAGVVLAIYFFAHWDLIATCLHVGRRYVQLQRETKVNHGLWLLIGLPIFLLFTSPVFWAFLAADLRRGWRAWWDHGGIGLRLTVCTVAVMLVTYFVGLSWELPRLWVAFVPTLTLGVMADRPLAHARSPRSLWPLVLIAAVQLLYCGVHGSILDARESEYRIISQRLYGMKFESRSGLGGRVQWGGQGDPMDLAVAVTERDHVRGAADAPVTLVEYGDYECPYCARAYPVVKEILARMGGKVRVVYRHFPQNSVHPHAAVAAQAAEAAGAQGKFWEMHDILYEHQDELGEGDMLHFALLAGVEVYRFESAVSSEVFGRRVRDDYNGGVRSGVKGTPTFFVNGVRYRGKVEFAEMAGAIEGSGIRGEGSEESAGGMA